MPCSLGCLEERLSGGNGSSSPLQLPEETCHALSLPTLVLSLVHLIERDPKSQSEWPPWGKELSHHVQDALGEEAPGGRTSWKTQLPWPLKLVLKPKFPWESCPTPGITSRKGSDRQALHVNPLRSACLWDHPSSNPTHIFGAKPNSWGRKKHVWSYPFPFLLCPSLPKQMHMFQGPHLQTFCFFEQFSYSKTAPLNVA